MLSLSFLIAGLILAPVFAIIDNCERRNSLKNTGFLMHDLKTGRWYE